MSWQSTSTIESLKQADKLRRAIHTWMADRDVLEVLTPSISPFAVTDPHIQSVELVGGGYLQTSPEFAMKRLLASHAQQVKTESIIRQPDLYQIARVFREEEVGRLHRREFTLLEWYRLGMDHYQLIEDITSLLQNVYQTFSLSWPGVYLSDYGKEIKKRLGDWPENLTSSDIQQYFLSQARSLPIGFDEELDTWLDLFIDEFVLPGFDPNCFTFLTDYPASQASLAKIYKNSQGRQVAARFELYFGQLELANGFSELLDSTEQAARFDEDNETRQKIGKAIMPIDPLFIEALQSGMPDCAGVAMGIERLHMVIGKHANISEVVTLDS